MAVVHESSEDEGDYEGSRPIIKKQKKEEVVKGLYLETVDRTKLDFDFEKLCSVSMNNINVYACLTCGKYFQGIVWIVLFTWSGL